MKKSLFLAALLFVTLMSQAQSITGSSQITLSTAGEPNKIVRFVISSSFSDAFDTDYDALAKNPGGIYVYSNGERYTYWASNGYSENLALGFATVGNKDYTLSFSNFTGESYKIRDLFTGTDIIVNGSTPDYNFSIEDAEKNTTINNRFMINYNAEGLAVCFINNKLTINDNPFPEEIVIETIDGTPIAGSPFDASTTLVDFTSIGAAGDRFVVKFHNGDKKLIFIKE